MKIIVKETGSDKWIWFDDESVKFTSNEDQATRFESTVAFNQKCLGFPSLLRLNDKRMLQPIVVKK